MKIPFLISSHPSNSARTNDLFECSKIIKESLPESFVISSSHCFPSENINFLVDYFLVDPKNEMLTREDIFEISSFDSMFYWNNFYIEGESKVFLTRGEVLSILPMHHYAAFKNILNGALFLKSMGFKYFISCDADIKFSNSDLVKFYTDCSYLEIENRGGMVFFSSPFGTPDAAIFCCNIDNFLDYCGSVGSKEEYKKLTRGDGFLVEKILHRISRTYNFRIVESKDGGEGSSEYFPSSKINSPSQQSSNSIPVFTLCTQNPVEGFFSNPNWFNDNFSFYSQNGGDSEDFFEKIFIVFLNRGGECVYSRISFRDETQEIAFEHRGNLIMLKEVDPEEVKKILSLDGKISISSTFEYPDGKVETPSFIFNDRNSFIKYLVLNQIINP
jgi:hypothetical protein